MSQPIPDVYMFEDALEQACVAHAAANGINDPKKQADNEGLKTPRVEFKALFSGPAVDEHYWINQSTKEKFLDCNTGRLYLKIVTRRGAADQDHSRLRGTMRGIMQNATALSSRMVYHRIEKIIEATTAPEFRADEFQDVSGIYYNVKMSILFDSKLAQIFPN